MLISVHDDMQLEEINDHFNLCFPNLKLAFFYGPHHLHAASDEKKALNQKMTVGEVRKPQGSLLMEISSKIKAGELESRFRHELGMNVQVYFRKGKDWQQSTEQDDLNLAALNTLGEE
jgi:hypothetical protein